jgi:excisionase family DNA binding protein
MRKKKNVGTDERALVTDVDGASAMLNRSRDSIYALLHAGELESYCDGRARRITIASIRKYIDRKVAAGFRRARYPLSKRDADQSAAA